MTQGVANPPMDALALEIALALVSTRFGISHEALMSVRRQHIRASFCRYVLAYLLHVEMVQPIRVIAKSLGKDPATLRYGILEVEEERDDKVFDELMSFLGGAARQNLAARKGINHDA